MTVFGLFRAGVELCSADEALMLLMSDEAAAQPVPTILTPPPRRCIVFVPSAPYRYAIYISPQYIPRAIVSFRKSQQHALLMQQRFTALCSRRAVVLVVVASGLLAAQVLAAQVRTALQQCFGAPGRKRLCDCACARECILQHHLTHHTIHHHHHHQKPQDPCSYDNPEGCGSASRITAPPPGAYPDKRRWPELVGAPAREARLTIETERPELTVHVSLVFFGGGGVRDDEAVELISAWAGAVRWSTPVTPIMQHHCDPVARTLQQQVIPPHSAVTADYRSDRVRLWVNEAGNVKKVPVVG